MRVIAGSLKGRVIQTVTGIGYRPATARVREAVFSMFESRGIIWSNTRVLDLFAGSGSLGFEALSRGAKAVSFVEKAKNAVDCLHKNAKNLQVSCCTIIANDVFHFLRTQRYQSFSLIFIDPPYRENRLAPVLSLLQQGSWIAPQGFILAEVEASLRTQDIIRDESFLRPLVDRTYGQTRISLWQSPQNV